MAIAPSQDRRIFFSRLPFTDFAGKICYKITVKIVEQLTKKVKENLFYEPYSSLRFKLTAL